MDADLGTLCTAVYVTADDLLPESPSTRAGRASRPEPSPPSGTASVQGTAHHVGPGPSPFQSQRPDHPLKVYKHAQGCKSIAHDGGHPLPVGDAQCAALE